MKKLICVLLLICICLPACAENAFTYQNGIQFGMTLEEVKALEDARNAGNDWYQNGQNSSMEMHNGHLYTILNSSQGNYHIGSEMIGYIFPKNADDSTLQEIMWLCFDLSSAASLRKLDYIAWQNGQVSFEPVNSFERILMDYELIEQTLSQKYGDGIESSRILSPYISEYIETSGYMPENFDFMVMHHLVQHEENITVVEHFIWYESVQYANTVCYFQMTRDEYDHIMQQDLIQEFLNNAL